MEDQTLQCKDLDFSIVMKYFMGIKILIVAFY